MKSFAIILLVAGVVISVGAWIEAEAFTGSALISAAKETRHYWGLGLLMAFILTRIRA